MKKIKTLLLIAPLAVLPLSYSSAVTILQGGSGDFRFDLSNDGSAVTDAEFGNLSFTGASKLVVTVGVKGSNISPDNQAGDVTYNGTTMSFAAGSAGTGSSAYGWIGIYYLDDPGSVGVGDLVVTDDGYSLGVSAMVLSGTASGFGASATSNSSSSVSLTTTSANSLVLAGYSDGGASATAVSPLTEIYSGLVGSGYHASGYQIVSTASTITPTFSVGSRPSITAAEFTAVPEPSTILLLGALGSLVFLRRRR